MSGRGACGQGALFTDDARRRTIEGTPIEAMPAFVPAEQPARLPVTTRASPC